MPTKFVIAPIFPVEEVHILAGASGAGKTTWADQTIVAQLQGQHPWGFEAQPLPWVYISADRSMAAQLATHERIGIELPQDRLVSLVDVAQELFSLITRELPKGGIAWIDGFQSLTPDGKISDYCRVRDFLCNATRFCKRQHVTIIGFAHATKCREGERYMNPRQRILGSVAWGGFCDTVILVEETSPESASSERTVLILPRNAEAITQELEFKAGRLVERDDDLNEMMMDQWLKQMAPGAAFNSGDMLATADKFNMSRASCYRWLKRKRSAFEVEFVARGEYRKPPVQ